MQWTSITVVGRDGDSNTSRTYVAAVLFGVEVTGVVTGAKPEEVGIRTVQTSVGAHTSEQETVIA